ncbi:MAG: glycosyltransferase family 39 protein [Nitrospirae bacterium]|nr:glycosyltransferase family 39 protein [Nitrospirota bacterium]
MLWHDFVDYDDFTFVVRNPNIQAGVTFEGIIWAFMSEYEANWIPLTWISHMLDVQLFGMNPAGHHFVNLLFHIASTLLLFSFFKMTTGALWRSAAVALLFAFHPLHVESVAWVAERKDVLSAFFWMLTMCAYVRYSDNPGVVRYLTVLGLFVLGLLSKPMVITMPFVLLMIDWWPLGRFSPAGYAEGVLKRSNLARLLVEKIPFIILSLCSGVITYIAHQADISYKLSFAEKVGRAVVAYTSYLGKMFWPANLAVIYPFSVEPPGLVKIIIATITVLTITALVFVMRQRASYLITGWMWYIITLLPVIGLVHIGHHAMADRYTYIPLIGVFVMLVWGISEVLKKWHFRKFILPMLFLLTLGGIVLITRMQLQHWKNSITLFSHAVEVTEKNWMAHNNLGKVILDEGRIDEAIMHFTKAVEANASFALPYLNMGFAYYYKYEFESARKAFESALYADPSCHPAHFGLGLVYLGIGNMGRVRDEYNYLVRFGSSYAAELMSAIINYNKLVGANPS